MIPRVMKAALTKHDVKASRLKREPLRISRNEPRSRDILLRDAEHLMTDVEPHRARMLLFKLSEKEARPAPQIEDARGVILNVRDHLRVPVLLEEAGEFKAVAIRIPRSEGPVELDLCLSVGFSHVY